MPDQFTKISTQGWGSRILGSLKGIFVGFLLFIISFGILYWNEGRVNVTKIAENAVGVSSTVQNTELDQQLVFSTGILSTSQVLGDTYLNHGNYISLKRTTEMYAWTENKKTQSEKNMGGSETKTETYNYEKDWIENPADSENFEYPEGHTNPNKTISSGTRNVENARLGIYNIDMNKVQLPSYEKLKLNGKAIPHDGLTLANEDYMFKGSGTITDPQIGDLRISYSAVKNNTGDNHTIFGKLDGKNISPYYGKKDTKLYRIFEGDRDTALSTMKTEHKIMTWIFRLIGFLLMWFGLMAILGPISVILDVVPFLGSVGRGATGLVSFVVALVLSIITIIVSMIIHNIFALIAVALIALILIIMFLKNKKQSTVPNQM